MSVINHATIQFMTTLALGRKSLFTVIRKLNGHPFSVSSISVNEHFNHFYKKTTNCINPHVPKRKVSKKSVETQIQALHSKVNELQG